MKEKCCGTCLWNKPSWETGHLSGFYCTNFLSDFEGCLVDYEYVCEDWEEK